MIHAVVTTPSPLTVTTEGASVAVPAEHLGQYTPTAGDEVRCLRDGTALLVLGKPV